MKAVELPQPSVESTGGLETAFIFCSGVWHGDEGSLNDVLVVTSNVNLDEAQVRILDVNVDTAKSRELYLVSAEVAKQIDQLLVQRGLFRMLSYVDDTLADGEKWSVVARTTSGARCVRLDWFPNVDRIIASGRTQHESDAVPEVAAAHQLFRIVDDVRAIAKREGKRVKTQK
jgi:hypothetical protein